MTRRRLSSVLAGFCVGLLFISPHSDAVERRISVAFRGPLKDAFKQIASKSGVSVVVTGDLDQPAEIYLKEVTAEEAIKTLAGAYHLQVEQQGNIWTIGPLRTADVPPVPASPETPKVLPTQPAPEQLTAKEEAAALRRIKKNILRKRYGRKGSSDLIQRGDLVVREGESVNSAVVYGGHLTIDGDAEGDAVAIGGMVTVNGHVHGDTVAIGGGVHLGPHAVVDGDVSAIGGEITREEGSEIGGNQVNVGGPLIGQHWVRQIAKSVARRGGPSVHDWDSDNISYSAGGGFWSFLLNFAIFFGLGFLFLIFAPNRMKQIESELKTDPLKCGLTGLVGMLAMIPLSVLLIITLIGIPFVIVLWLLAGLGVAMGIAAIANEVGTRLPWFKLRKTQAGVLALGMLILLLVCRVPIIGPIAFGLVALLAFGAIIRTRFGQRPPMAQPV
jgi:hypothetical protein